jgi:Icc-related predicted phosphoesterase
VDSEESKLEPSMKILVVADIHYSLPQFDWIEHHASEYDWLIIAGDVLDLAGHADLDTQIVVVRKYLARLRALTKVFVCSGNHDGDVRNQADEVVAAWLQKSRAENLFVDGDGYSHPDVRITVLPWWDGPVTQKEMLEILEAERELPKSTWILVHHAPPDNSPVCWAGKKHIGDPVFLETLQRLQPDFAFSGHIHNSPFDPSGSWIDRIGKTWVFNPGRQLGGFPAHIQIDLEEMTAAWVTVYGVEVRDLRQTEPSGPAKETAAVA